MAEPMGLDEKALEAAMEAYTLAQFGFEKRPPECLSDAIKAYLRTAGLVPVPVIGEGES